MSPPRSTAAPEGLRGMLRAYLPSWLAEGDPEDPSVAFRVLWTLALFGDLFVAIMLQGSLAAVGRGTVASSALKYIGQARRVPRGRIDTDASYVAELRRWIDRAKARGSSIGLALALHRFLGGSRVRVITRGGTWTTADEDGAITTRGGPWDWDSVSHPERAEWWSDEWIVIYTPYAVRPGTLGALTGEDGYALGHMVPDRDLDVLRAILLDTKSAHSCIRAVIWTSDPTQFDPDVPASLPDGTWGAWSTRGNGSRVASGRFADCRFWEPR